MIDRLCRFLIGEPPPLEFIIISYSELTWSPGQPVRYARWEAER